MIAPQPAPLLHDNLVRVFELPDHGSNDFLFGRSEPVTFHEKDWFNAVPYALQGYGEIPNPRTDPDGWEMSVREWLEKKVYLKPDKMYLALNLHRSFVFWRRDDSE